MYELIQFTINPINVGQKPEVYIQLHRLNEKKDNSLLPFNDAAKVAKIAHHLSQLNGNNTRADQAFARATRDRLSAKLLNIIHQDNPDIANNRKRAAIEAIDTSRYILLNTRDGGARHDPAAEEMARAENWNYYRQMRNVPSFCQNIERIGLPPTALRDEIVQRILQGKTASEAYEQLFGAAA